MSKCPVCHADTDADARYCGGCGAAITNTESSQHNLPRSPDAIGREVAGRYRILAKLGEGGMGAVYRAEQISLKRGVALKVLKPELSAEPGLVRRFNAEAELAAKLNHPNTVTLYDFGQDESGALFIAMEFIEGRSLRQELVRQGALRIDRIFEISSQICASLADAHATGIVHRDLKPDNVMLSERGRNSSYVTVLDFGIAKLREENGDITQQPMTRAGDILGTPQYMAPEQIRGEQVDARTDVYALGVMLYEMATARLPFEGSSVMALLSKHLTEEPVPPTAKRPDLEISPALSGLIMHCLAKDPNQRPATMDQVEQALSAALAASPSPSGYVTNPQHAPQVAPTVGMHPSYASQAAPATPALLGAPSALGHSAQAPMPHPHALSQPGVPALASPQAIHQETLHTRSKPRSRTLLWSLLLLLLFGAGGAGAYFMLANKDEAGEPKDEFDMSAWEGDSEGDRSEAPENTQDQLDDFNDEVNQVFEDLEADEADEDDNGASEQLYRDAVFGYSMEMPADFVGGGDGFGNATFAGLVQGNQVNVFASAWAEPGQFGEAELEAALQIKLSLIALETTSSGWIGSGNNRRLRGSLHSLSDDQMGDFVLARRGAVFYFAVVGGPPRAYRNTSGFRQAFLNGGFQLP